MSITLKTNYALKLREKNFYILKIEDLLKQDNVDAILKNHKVNFYTLMFFTSNKGKHAIDFKDFACDKGTILSIRKDQIHKFYLNYETTGFLLFFKEEFLNRYLNEDEVAKSIQMFNEMLTSPKTQLNNEDFIGVVSLVAAIEKEVFQVKDKYSMQIIRSLIYLLITLIHRVKSRGYRKVQLDKYLKEFIKFQNLIEQDYYKTKKVFDYANKLGYSTKKLNSIVQFVVNKPAKDFIDDTLIVKIKGQLLHSNLSIKEIAFKVGFKDSSNLFKYFKKHTNYTPEVYRKKYKV